MSEVDIRRSEVDEPKRQRRRDGLLAGSLPLLLPVTAEHVWAPVASPA